MAPVNAPSNLLFLLPFFCTLLCAGCTHLISKYVDTGMQARVRYAHENMTFNIRYKHQTPKVNKKIQGH